MAATAVGYRVDVAPQPAPAATGPTVPVTGPVSPATVLVAGDAVHRASVTSRA